MAAATSKNPPADSNSVCAACGVAFRCGMVSADATCWCFALPHVMAVPAAAAAAENADNARCLCPTCLHQQLEEKHHGNQP
ncbi:MAG: hypothetical protein ACI87L_001538 [Litorivivens sp.]|jgi:hypothetical protein